MEGWQNKDKTILEIYPYINTCFGQDYFTLPSFWGGDNFPIGLKREGMLIYISRWNTKDRTTENMEYYFEFEIMNPATFKTSRTERTFQSICCE